MSVNLYFSQNNKYILFFLFLNNINMLGSVKDNLPSFFMYAHPPINWTFLTKKKQILVISGGRNTIKTGAKIYVGECFENT